jgi:hypothetical protein
MDDSIPDIFGPGGYAIIDHGKKLPQNHLYYSLPWQRNRK